jgi:chromosome segregation ATPase
MNIECRILLAARGYIDESGGDRMLEQKDLDMLKNMVQSVVDDRMEKSERKMESMLGSLKETQDAMQKDIRMLKEIQGVMQEDIRMLKEKQDAMQETQSTMQEDIRSLKETQSTMQEDIRSLKETQSTMQEDIRSLKETQSAVLKTQRTIQRDIRMLKKTQNTMSMKQSTMQNDIRSLKKTQGTTVEEVKDLKQNQEFIVGEIGRTQTYLEKRIDKVERKLDEVGQFYRITRLDNSTTTELVKICDDLTDRVERLERKMA